VILSVFIFWTLIVIGLGGWTRLMHAGLGCPDWPGCYGHWILPQQDLLLQPLSWGAYIEAWIEMIHRYAAGLLGVAVIALGCVCLWKRRYPILGFALIVLIIFQALLGMWTVTLKLHPIIVSLHFLGGLTLFMLLSGLKALQYWDRQKTWALPPALACNLDLCIGVYLLQILLGAWVSTNYAGLSCASSILTCPQMHSWTELSLMIQQTASIWHSPDPLAWYSPAQKAWIQGLHRFNALVFGFILWRVRSKVWSEPHTITALGPFIDCAAFLYIVQMSIGLILIGASLPLWAAVCHNIVAALTSLPLVFLWTYRMCQKDVL